MSNVIELRAQEEAPQAETRRSGLAFINDGTLDINLIKLMGCSVKESESPIGFFGTGLKYAMAAALRLGGSMEIVTGGKIYHVGEQEIILRDKSFMQVQLGDEALGFTTELGKQWEAWMVVRELYSNTLDEGGHTSITMQEASEIPHEGKTIIILRGQPFLDVWEKRGEYFVNQSVERPVHTSPYVDAYPGTNNQALFYKGIRVHQSNLPFAYRYNLKDTITLTEDRTIKYDFQFREALEKSIITSHDAQYIATCLTSDTFRESKLEFTELYSGIEMSAEFQSVCFKLNERANPRRNKAAIKWWKNRTNKTAPMVDSVLTKVQKSQLDKSINFLRRIGYEAELDRYPIRVVQFLGENIHGKALDDTVFISRDCFDKGTKYLASTILEELVHLHYGLPDESYALQTWLFDRIITMGEEFATGEAL